MQEKLRDELISFGRYAAEHGWVPATSGNLSVRLDPKSFLVTCSGSDLSKLDTNSFAVMDLVHDEPGVFVNKSEMKASAETALHAQVYARQPHCQAVLHVHAASAVNATMIWDEDVISIKGYELQKAITGFTSHQSTLLLPVFTNSQNIDSLAAEVDAYMQEENPNLQAYLIRGHGLYTWGATIDDAKRHVEAIDALLSCEIFRRAHAAA